LTVALEGFAGSELKSTAAIVTPVIAR
jgi:hypothetical protein